MQRIALKFIFALSSARIKSLGQRSGRMMSSLKNKVNTICQHSFAQNGKSYMLHGFTEIAYIQCHTEHFDPDVMR
jgi:hypothetical protein